MGRMNSLIGEDFRIHQFRSLPLSHQLAIAWYMAIDGQAWDCFIDENIRDEEEAKAALMAAIPNYAIKYGDTLWGTADLPVDRVITAVMADEDISSSFHGWDDYAVWYGDVPEHGPANRWPVILSSSDDATLQDGWHRLHSYIRAGHLDIPAVFYPLPSVESSEGDRFNYLLLGRLQHDCEHYLDVGARNKSRLWAQDEAEQIKKMRDLYAALPEKPAWITPADIDKYEAAMVTHCPYRTP